jgi:hypothetical protein
MANTFVGVGVLWGFPGGPTNTLTGLGVLTQLQSSDFGSKAQKDQIKDTVGNTSAVVYSDHEYSLKWDFVLTSSTNTGNLTVASLPAIGSTLAVTDANFTPASVTWLCDDITVSRGNTKAAMATISLSRYLNNSVPT